MKTKYDWSNVPSEVKYLAVDKGEIFAYGFRDLPNIFFDDMWIGSVVDGVTDLNLICECDWKDSLEERPHDL